MKHLMIYVAMLIGFAVKAQQQYRFITYNVSDGLSQNSVHSIFQDSDGMIWFGTQDGLNSFDGKHFRNYRSSASDTNTISDQFILSIVEDNKGYLWVGTRNGLNKLNRRTGKVIRYYLTERERNVIFSPYWKLEKNASGEILMTKGAQQGYINQEGYLVALDASINFLHRPVYDKTGRLWGFHSKDEKLYQVVIKPGGKVINTNTHVSFPSVGNTKRIVKCVMDTAQVLWCYTDESKSVLAFYNTLSRQWIHQPLHFKASINHINIARNGTGWISASDGLYLVENYSTVTKVGTQAMDGLPAGGMLYSYEDMQGNMWVGSATGGVAYYHTSFNNFQVYRLQGGQDAVTAAIDMGNDRWIAASSGLYHLKKNAAVSYAYTISNRFFAGKKVTAMTNDHQGRIWAAVEKQGIYVLNTSGKIIQQFTQNDTLLQTGNVLNLYCDSHGRVFVSTEQGFFVYTTAGIWKSFFQNKMRHSMKSGWYVLSVFEDSQQRIWVSKHLGIDVYDKNLNFLFSLLSANVNDPIKRTIITACTEDNRGDIWIATLSNGVYRYRHQRLQQYTATEGLSGSIMYGITSDAAGRIWTTSTTGISVYKQEEDRFYTLTSNDGLSGVDYVLGSLSKNKEGKLLAGSSSGLITIDADKIVLNNRNARAQVIDVKINGESIAELSRPLVLHPGYKTISFEFSLKEAFQPHIIFYQYRMLGVDTAWNMLPADNTKITYTGLPGKKLQMQVRAAYLPGGLPSAPIEQFDIEVKPYFWQTNWFWIVVALLVNLLTSVAIVTYNRSKQRRQRQVFEMQQQIRQERERISRDLHDNIGAYTSALIAAINQLKYSDNPAEDVNELNDYATNIMDYLRETIWVLNHEAITLTAFTDRYKSYAQKIIRHYPSVNIEFETRITNERNLHPEVSLNLFRILQEALQNACKYATAQQIRVEFSSESRMYFSLRDDGGGFDLYSRTEGQGIRNMIQRAADIGFTCEINSEKGMGTQITLSENSTNAVSHI